MLQNSQASVSELRQQVTSPGGTTQAALESLAAEQFSELVYRAAAAAQRRGVELSAESTD
jgi:pyrroline-5-carboxylate reductase